MKKNYFTISEFGKLRNININSLRYYEKIGLLTPNYVDPKTNYRYYTAKQLMELDVIHLCIMLGIPLKELKKYNTEKEGIEIRKLLEDGKKIAEERIAETKANLKQIEITLDNIDSLKAYENKNDKYIRKIRERKLVISESFEEIDIHQIEKETRWIHKYAQNNKLYPILPAGMIIEFTKEGKAKHRMFFEITNQEAKGEQIITLPEGDYLCTQTYLKATEDVKEIIKKTYGKQEHSIVIVSNMILEKLSYKEKIAEIQKKI